MHIVAVVLEAGMAFTILIGGIFGLGHGTRSVSIPMPIDWKHEPKGGR
jgi:hypothetical protein